MAAGEPVAQRGLDPRPILDPARQQLGDPLGPQRIPLTQPTLPLGLVIRTDPGTDVIDIGIDQPTDRRHATPQLLRRVAMTRQFLDAHQEVARRAQVICPPEHAERDAPLRQL